MSAKWLVELAGTHWSGTGELWLDSEGNTADRCECTMRIESGGLHYAWSYDGKAQEGSFAFGDDGATWTDSWHHPKSAKCADVPDAWGHFTVMTTYAAPPGPDWGWRIKLSQRPDGALVLQMENITPWGEEGRAVRMICTRAE